MPAIAGGCYTVTRYNVWRYIVSRTSLSSPGLYGFPELPQHIGGTADDQLLAGLEGALHRRVRLELARTVAHDRHDVDAATGQVCHGLAGERALGDARPRRELRDLPAGAGVRRDGPVGAGLTQLRLRVVLVGARNDEQLRV